MKYQLYIHGKLSRKGEGPSFYLPENLEIPEGSTIRTEDEHQTCTWFTLREGDWVVMNPEEYIESPMK
jgi:hypothetical protein